MEKGILVVDDEPTNRKIAQRTLEKQFQVKTASSGQEALEILAGYHPNLILLDIRMPDMDGFETFSKIRSNPSIQMIPVVFLTAENEAVTEVRALKDGASDFIAKPFVPAIMLQRVSRIIELDDLKNNLEQEVQRQIFKRQTQMEHLTVQIMKTLAETIDAKDVYTNGHSNRVADYSREIARRLHKTEEEQKAVYRMGLLHDIGKIGVPDAILNKPIQLTAEEYKKIQEHTIIGYGILQNITEIPDIGIGARSHHERFDGKGYPDGLQGDEIPEMARIIGVADAYDAMTSRRSYRDILPQQVARKQIEAGKGKQFDPKMADCMLAMIDEDTAYQLHE